MKNQPSLIRALANQVMELHFNEIVFACDPGKAETDQELRYPNRKPSRAFLHFNFEDLSR